MSDAAIAYLTGRGLWPAAEGIVRFDDTDPAYPIVLPLRDAAGEIVGTERRAMRDDASPKIRTDAGSVKTGSTFGALSGDAERVWIVEGFTDFLAAEAMSGRLGVEALGVPGTGLAESAILARKQLLHDRLVFISFDKDDEGQKATARARLALERIGARPAVAPYPEGYTDRAEIVERLRLERAAETLRVVFDRASRRSPLRSHTWRELDKIASTRPPRDLIVKPFLARYESGFLYGYKGHGKTFVALGLAMVGAQGEGGKFLEFEGVGPGVPTLYVDGEMFTVDLNQRRRDLMSSCPRLDPDDRLHLWTPDAQDDQHTVLNLFSQDGRRMLEDHIEDISSETGQVIAQIFFDNMSSLLHGWEENKQESWMQVAPWLLQLRAQRRGNFWIHHAGKSLDYRGNSAMIGTMHTVLKVVRPQDAPPGADFDFTYEYTRAKPVGLDNFNARLEGNVWTIETLGEASDELIEILTHQGVGPTDIGKQIGKSKDAVMRAQKRLGLRLPKSGKSGWGDE